MSVVLQILMAMLLALAVPDQGSQAVRADLAMMEGEFYLVAGEINGQAMPDDMVKSARRVTKNGVVTVYFGGQAAMTARIILDPSKKPRELNYEMIDGPSKGRRQLGIYELFDNPKHIELKLCVAGPDFDRPIDYSTSPGSGRTMTVWRRDKPGD